MKKYNSRLFSLFAILVVALAIPATVLFSRGQQIFWQHAYYQAPSNNSAIPTSPLMGIHVHASIVLDRVTWVSLSGLNSFQWNETVKSQNNRLLVVAVALRDYTTGVTNITYGGIPLRRIGSANCRGNYCSSQLWYLTNPPIGTNTVIVNTSANTAIVGSSVTFYNVSQTWPIAAFVTGGGWDSTATVNLQTNPSQVVVDSFAGGGTNRFTPAAGQTQQWYDFNLEQGSGSTKQASAINTTMTWTASKSDAWADVAAAINPAP